MNKPFRHSLVLGWLFHVYRQGVKEKTSSSLYADQGNPVDVHIPSINVTEMLEVTNFLHF